MFVLRLLQARGRHNALRQNSNSL